MTLLHSELSVCIEAIRKTIRPSKSQTRVRACCFIAAAVSAVLASAVPALAQRSTPIQLVQPMGAANDEFSSSTAVSGDTMIVGSYLDDIGANTDQGSALIYRWTGTGWSLEATLTAADGAAGDYFGYTVAVSGDTVIVTAVLDDVGGNADEGSAYIFTRLGTTWTQQDKVVASDGAGSDYFGIASSVSSDTVIIGAVLSDVGGNADQGAAYIFKRTDTTWSQQAKLIAFDGLAQDFFGVSVSIDDDTVVIGAANDDVAANPDQGSAYVFLRSGVTWTQQAKLTASDGAASDSFGISVSLAEDTVLVGAHFADIGVNPNQGAGYVFTRTGTTWTQQAKLTASDGLANDQFANSVAISGDTAVLGAFAYNTGRNGSAYVLERTGMTWAQQAKLTAPDGAASDEFGYNVSVYGDTAIVSARHDDVGAHANQGSAWLFSRVGTTWIGPDSKISPSDGSSNDQAGHVVAISGNTMVISSYLDDVGANVDQGSARVYRSKGTGWEYEATLTASDGAAGDRFGYHSIAIDGDTIVIGAVYDTVGASPTQGSAYVFARSGSSWIQQAKLIAADGEAGDRFAESVSISGNTIAIGAQSDTVGGVFQGSAYVFTRSGTIWTQQAKLVASDGTFLDYFGNSIAVYGDTVFAGSPYAEVGGNVDQGAVYVFVRSGTSWSQQAKITAPDGMAGDRFGQSFAISGETAVIGSVQGDVGVHPDQGSAYIFVRSGNSWSQQAKLIASDGAAIDAFGGSVAISVDTVVIGALLADVGMNVDQGSAYVFTRNGSIWTQQAKLTAADGAANDYFGYSVAVSGGTAVIGVPLEDVGSSIDQGSAWVYSVAEDDFAVAHNDTLDVSYASVAAAVAAASPGDAITATSKAFAKITTLDTGNKSVEMKSTGPIRTTSQSDIKMGGESSMKADRMVGGIMKPAPIDFRGRVDANSGGNPKVTGSSVTVGSQAQVTVNNASSLTLDAPKTKNEGKVVMEPEARKVSKGEFKNTGSVDMKPGSAMTNEGATKNRGEVMVKDAQVTTPIYTNTAKTDVSGNSNVNGNFKNETAAKVEVSGKLRVAGGMVNAGSIRGIPPGPPSCENCLGEPPSLEIDQDFILEPEAELTMPVSGSIVRVGGNFDCAIDSNTRFNMALATLQMDGPGPEQTLEVMSIDTGLDPNAMNQAFAGHYPIGQLKIGPSTTTTVRLVDNRDNDGQGQGFSEGMYIDQVVIDPGATLDNTQSPVYYDTLENNGTIQEPGNIIQNPPCPADFNLDGGIDGQDIEAFFMAWEAGAAVADTNGDGGIDGSDVATYFISWESGGC